LSFTFYGFKLTISQGGHFFLGIDQYHFDNGTTRFATPCFTHISIWEGEFTTKSFFGEQSALCNEDLQNIWQKEARLPH
jgi:hypothetical protein